MPAIKICSGWTRSLAPLGARCHVRNEQNADRAMNLGVLLHFNGLNRNSFHTLDRRAGGLAFMRRDVTSATKKDRYSFTHAAALGCLLEFMRAGLSNTQAAAAVDDAFGVIDSFVGSVAWHQANPGNAWVTIVNLDDGRTEMIFGDGSSAPFEEAEVVSKVSVNLAAIWLRLSRRFDAPALPADEAEGTPEAEQPHA